MLKTPLVLITLLAGSVTTPAFAQAATGHDAHHVAQPATSGAAMANGEVRKVDKDAGKITLKHDEIPGLGMPPMTMVFRVSDPKMLDQVKPGDKVKFNAEQKSGQLTVTQIEPAR
jgi:Cu/Ag efflux protein CusF